MPASWIEDGGISNILDAQEGVHTEDYICM